MAKPAREDARDPRYRTYRIFFYALYILVVTAFSVNVTVSVVRSVMAMTPARKAPTETVLSVRECVEGAERLWDELDARRQTMAPHEPARRVDQDWSLFRVKWLTSFREMESQCAVDARSRQPVKAVYSRLNRIMDLYTTHSVQFAGEVGGAIDAFREALRAVKSDPTVGRFP